MATYNKSGHTRSEGAVQIIQYDQNKPVYLDIEALSTILLREDVKNTPVVLFSIAGAYRTGKSFILNFFLRYLRALEHGNTTDWLGDIYSELTGFKWEMGINRATDGILLWSRPFFLKNRFNKKVAVLLMDTQGLFDGVTSRGTANAMITLSTLLSSMQVFNVKEKLDESNFITLELFAEAGILLSNAKLGRGLDAPFQRATFLVRDWMGGKKHKTGEEGGRTYLDDKLEVQHGQPEDIRMVRKNLRSCFEKIDCFLMPHPGLSAALQTDDDDYEFKGKIAELDSRFCNALEKLVCFFFDPDKIRTKWYGGVEVTGAKMIELFKTFSRLFADGKVPLPTTTREVLIAEYNLMMMDSLLKGYGRDLQTQIEAKHPYPREELKRRMLSQSIDVQKQFEVDCRGTDEEREKSKSDFIKRIETIQKEIEGDNEEILVQIEERNKEKCMEQFSKAKAYYRDRMDLGVLNGTEAVENDKLQALHLETLGAALETFDKETLSMGDEKLTFREELRSFIDLQMKKYVVQNEGKRKIKSWKELAQMQTIERAKDQYFTEMEQKFDIGKDPKPDNDVEEFSNVCIERAKSICQQSMSRDEGVSDSYIEELERFCRKEQSRFTRNNTFNREMKRKRELDIIARANYVAIKKYKAFMMKNCTDGQPYRSTSQMDQLHKEAVEVAMVLHKTMTETCVEIKFDKSASISFMLTEEKEYFMRLNERLDPHLITTKQESPC